MLKRVTLTRHETVEHWDSWIVAVPDDMADERIMELMRDTWNYGDLELCEAERRYDDDVSIDITEAPPGATGSVLTLTNNGLVDERAIFAATTDRLQAELDRRRVGEQAVADDKFLIKLKKM